MITYIIKTLLCAAVLFLIYVLLLEREKMHRFNRFYLLFSIIFSFTVSFITIRTQAPVVAVGELIVPAAYMATTASPATDLQQAPTSARQVPDPASTRESNLQPNLLLFFYIAGTAFLLFRFIRNLSVLLSKTISNKKAAYHGATLVLTNDDAVPHSFLKYIFINKEKFEQGTIEKEILQHELTHVNQKHSIDVLMIELVMVFAWINPFLFMFRKAILLNHEFLADEAVVNTFKDADSYRLLLFSKASRANNLVLSSPFNYLITKKRLIMMTRKTSQRVAILKQIALIPLIAAIGFLFSTRVIAQDNPKQPVTQKQVEASKTDAPQSVVDEFHAILKKYKVDTLAIKTLRVKTRSMADLNEWGRLTHLDTLIKIDRSEFNRLGLLFSQMSKEQRKHAFMNFSPITPLKTKIVPTKEQFKSWKNSKIYCIIINGRRVKNSILSNHLNTDYAYFVIRNVDKDEVKFLKYQVEVDLLTNANFEKERKSTFAHNSSDKYYLSIKFPRTQEKNKPVIVLNSTVMNPL